MGSTADWVQAWAAVAGVLVAIGGFGSVWYQLKEARKATENQTRWAIEQVSCDVYSMFVDEPGLYRSLYEEPAAKEQPFTDDQRKLEAAIELMVDYFEAIVESKDLLDKSTGYAWQIYMKQTYERSAVMRDFLKREECRYTPKLSKLLMSPPSSAELIQEIRQRHRSSV